MSAGHAILIDFPTCRKRDGKPCCMHRSPLTYMSNPPQYDETCCWCGRTERRVEVTSVTLRTEPHGQHCTTAFTVRYMPNAPIIVGGTDDASR